MKSSVFVNVVANIVIVVVVLGITLACFGGTSNVFATADITPIYRGSKSGNVVTLMVNVYWGSEYIDEMLTIFDKYNVKTTFFVGGYWVAKNEELLVKIYEAGHEIGNHGYHHKDHDKLSLEQNLNEIEITHSVVKSDIGIDLTLFAPPSGYYNKNTINACSQLGYKMILWSRDTIDWRDKNSELVYNRCVNNISSGELILMHPTPHTVKALPKILEYYANNGYKVVTVSQNIKGES